MAQQILHLDKSGFWAFWAQYNLASIGKKIKIDEISYKILRVKDTVKYTERQLQAIDRHANVIEIVIDLKNKRVTYEHKN